MNFTDHCVENRCGFCRSPYIAFVALLMLTVFWFAANLGITWAQNPPFPVLKQVEMAQHPVFDDDLDFAGLEKAIQGNLAYYRKLPPAREFPFGRDTYAADHMIRSLQRFLTFIDSRPSQQELKGFIDRNYRVYAYIKDAAVNDVLFTGYYEPMLCGSLKPTEIFRYPVYSRPDDLVIFDKGDVSTKGAGNSGIGRYDGEAVVPYYTRQQISEMAPSSMNATPIAWVNDPVALFFLQIQGSGKISLDTGGIINVHYHLSNGHPYKSIGKYLIDKKKLSRKTVSMQMIRKYLNDHPDEMEDIFNYNPRYIFFETMENGPKGCFNIELTPGRSLALDRQIAPAGALVFVQSQKPAVDASGNIRGWVAFSRFFLNQDTGSAIKGPGRADVFWGNGPYAELAAGHMKHPGQLYFLVLKPGIDGEKIE